MTPVVLESPYGGDVARNVAYVRACLRDCLTRGEAPIASHLLYTQEGVLDDGVFEDRQLGMAAGWAWMRLADLVVVYEDLGVSDGMTEGIEVARAAGTRVEYRKLGGEWARG